MSHPAVVKLSPAFKDYLWGGARLRDDFHKVCALERIAESWELSAHKDGQSTVAEGAYKGMTLSEYIHAVGTSVLGKNSQKYDYFPLLIKLIDAKGNLSVQVHPDDTYALEHEGEYGKTEMWYILDCDEGASLYYGFAKDITKDAYAAAIREGTLTELLNRVEVKPGDVYFIPAGTVHAIGAGILICEIQQNSNTTYRVYDYNRRDKDGNTRPLHIDKALEVSTLTKSPALPVIDDGDDVLLCECEYFEVRRLRFAEDGEVLAHDDSFLSLTVTAGEGILTHAEGVVSFSKGDTLFVLAASGACRIRGNCEMIQAKVR